MGRHIDYKVFRKEAIPFLVTIIENNPGEVNGLSLLEVSYPENSWHEILRVPWCFVLEETIYGKHYITRPEKGFYSPEQVARELLSHVTSNRAKDLFVREVREKLGVDFGKIVRNHVFGQET